MKFEVFNEPILLDFIRVVLNAAPDQIEHLETMSGEKWTIDGVALGSFTAPGPKWSIRIDDVPVVIGGFAPQRKGVYRDWFISTRAAFEPSFSRQQAQLQTTLQTHPASASSPACGSRRQRAHPTVRKPKEPQAHTSVF